MKNILIIFVVFSCFLCYSGPNNTNLSKFSPINDKYANSILNAIFVVEGGNKTKYPFGIKSIDTKGNKELAKRICLNTIKNNYLRWQADGKPEHCYLDYLANRYCPMSCDKVGNTNWKKNIHRLVLTSKQ